MKCDFLRELKDFEWDKRVRSSVFGRVTQIKQWADFMRIYYKADPYFMVVSEDSRPVSLLLFFREAFAHSVFFERPLDGFFIKFLKKAMPVFTAVSGPLIISNNKASLLKETISFFSDFCSKHRAKKVTLENFPLQKTPFGKVNEIFNSKGFFCKKWATFVVDVTPDEKILWSNIKKDARKLINRSEKKGAKVEMVKNVSELKEYDDLLTESRKRLGFRKFSFNNRLMLWKTLRSESENFYEVFVARKGGEVLGGMGVLAFNGVVRELSYAQSKKAFEQKIYSGDLLKWGIIKWAHEQGYKEYDLAGVNPEPQTPKEKGIFDFKKKWGGKLVYTYDFCKVRK